jgi:hypothetical protein
MFMCGCDTALGTVYKHGVLFAPNHGNRVIYSEQFKVTYHTENLWQDLPLIFQT